MGLASNQARLNLLTSRKADLEYRLTSITNQVQKLAIQQSAIVSKKAAQMEVYNQQNKNNDQAVQFEYTQAYADYEAQMNLISVAQTKLDNQQKMVETQHQAVNAEQEQVKKLVESNVKTSFKLFN